MQIPEIIEKLKLSDKRTIARAITYVEENSEKSTAILKNIYQLTGNAYRIGITGPPGAGKSTITNQLTKHYRTLNKKVGIIAVDPTSPFTGGALLGDRVRMSEIGQDPGVFIRSMATRGSLGGLSRKAIDAADLLDAAGYDIVIFETVGVGQSELDIAQAADTTIVVLVPESGDSVQAMKAGLMEIADFFVVNKSDRPGSDQAVTALRTIMMMRPHDIHSWMPNIIKTVASDNKGIQEIASEISRHTEYLHTTDSFISKRNTHKRNRVKDIVEDKLKSLLWDQQGDDSISNILKNANFDDLSPYFIAEQILTGFKYHL